MSIGNPKIGIKLRGYDPDELRSRVIRRLKECLSRVDRIVFAILFGSVARGTASENSDVDIAVYFDGIVDIDERIELTYLLARCLGLSEDKIDLVLLDDQTPLELRYKIFRDGILILARDMRIYKSYRDKSISMYLDLKVSLRANGYNETYMAKLRERILGAKG